MRRLAFSPYTTGTGGGSLGQALGPQNIRRSGNLIEAAISPLAPRSTAALDRQLFTLLATERPRDSGQTRTPQNAHLPPTPPHTSPRISDPYLRKVCAEHVRPPRRRLAVCSHGELARRRSSARRLARGAHYFRGERARDRAGRGAHESAGRKRREPHGARHFGTVLDLGRDTPPRFSSLVSDQMGFAIAEK